MLLHGDCLSQLKTLPDASVQCCVTSPPYWGLRDYGVEGQLGLESTPDAYVQKMVAVFREVRRVLKDDGTCWVNLGDSYAANGVKNSQPQTNRTSINGVSVRTPRGTMPSDLRANLVGEFDSGLKPKDLVGIPWRVAFALQADGWYLRSDIIWHKPNPMPESVTDRPTKSHEYIFLLTKSERYFYDHEAIKEPLERPDEGTRKTPAKFGGADKFAEAKQQSRLHSGNEYLGTVDGKRNKRTVWTVATQPYAEAHFATFPPKLIEPCILAGSRPGDVVLDPFAGSGTALYVAKELGRQYLGIELNPDYIKLIEKRLAQEVLAL